MISNDPRFVSLLPAIHAELEIFSRSSGGDSHALVMCNLLEQVAAILDSADDPQPLSQP